MNFNFTEQQQLMQGTIRRFIAKDYGFERRRELVHSEEGFSRETWCQFADLGLLGLTFQEQHAGGRNQARRRARRRRCTDRTGGQWLAPR